jgi:hypothetical protein
MLVMIFVIIMAAFQRNVRGVMLMMIILIVVVAL